MGNLAHGFPDSNDGLAWRGNNRPTSGAFKLHAAADLVSTQDCPHDLPTGREGSSLVLSRLEH